MTIHVNIGQAKTRLSELVAAAVRGEEIILSKAGTPLVRLVPVEDLAATEQVRIAERRSSALGMWREAMAGYDLSLEALKADRLDPDDRERRLLGPAA